MEIFEEGIKEGVKIENAVLRGGYNGRGEANTSFHKKHGNREKSKRERTKEGGVYV